MGRYGIGLLIANRIVLNGGGGGGDVFDMCCGEIVETRTIVYI